MNDYVLQVYSTSFGNAWRHGRKYQARRAGQPKQMNTMGASAGIEFARHRMCQG